MVPFARELLRMGAEVVMVANSLPAINDITTPELRALLQAVSEVDPVIKVGLTELLQILPCFPACIACAQVWPFEVFTCCCIHTLQFLSMSSNSIVGLIIKLN